jgi:hypothetical protein
MTIAQLTEKIAKNEALREELFRQKEPIDKELTRLYNQNENLNDQISEIREKEMEETKVIDWEWLLHTNHAESSMKKYHLRSKVIQSLGLMSNGFYEETSQTAIQIGLVKHDEESLAKILQGLKVVLPHIKPLLSQDGFKRIQILESNCGANGIYYLTINQDETEFLIKRDYYSRTEIIHKCDYLEEALKIIQKKYYYSDKDDD